MPNTFYHLLATWLPCKHDHSWVLGAVINTHGSVYRKTGALMLLSDAGHQLGLLSGGCIESDLLLQARKVLALGKSRRITYDATDEDNLAWRLGIGCGGVAEILLHPCNESNDFLKLEKVQACLDEQQACNYTLQIDTPQASVNPGKKNFYKRQAGQLITNNKSGLALTTLLNPLPHLLLLGSGMDLIPVCELAITMGWRVTLADQRLTPQKCANFPKQISTLQVSASELDPFLLQHIDGVVIAHHNVRLDAAAMTVVQHAVTDCSYIGLLGPAKRKADVLALAGLNEHQLAIPVAGPMGLALGGDLPESIALSVLAECHAVIFGSNALPLSHMSTANLTGIAV